MGGILYATLQPVEGVIGLGQVITGISLWIELVDAEAIRKETDLVVHIQMKINKLNHEVVISQCISSNQITDTLEKRLPIEGTLWVPGTPSEIEIESHSVEVYYVPV